MKFFFDIEGSPLWIFQEILKIAMSSTDVDEKSFIDEFLISYIVEVQTLPTLRPFNFVRVNQSLQPHVRHLFSLQSELT